MTSEPEFHGVAGVDKKKIAGREAGKHRSGNGLAEFRDQADIIRALAQRRRGVGFDAGDLRHLAAGGRVHFDSVQHAHGRDPAADLNNPPRLPPSNEAMQNLRLDRTVAQTPFSPGQALKEFQPLDLGVVVAAGFAKPFELCVQVPVEAGQRTRRRPRLLVGAEPGIVRHRTVEVFRKQMHSHAIEQKEGAE